jgi:hypothetical protein
VRDNIGARARALADGVLLLDMDRVCQAPTRNTFAAVQ